MPLPETVSRKLSQAGAPTSHGCLLDETERGGRVGRVEGAAAPRDLFLLGIERPGGWRRAKYRERQGERDRDDEHREETVAQRNLLFSLIASCCASRQSNAAVVDRRYRPVPRRTGEAFRAGSLPARFTSAGLYSRDRRAAGESTRGSRRHHSRSRCKYETNTDRHITGSETLSAQAQAVVDALARFSHQITRVEIHLSDQNGARGGVADIRCVMEARLEGRPPTAVTHQASTVAQAMDGAADKLSHSIESTLGRLRDSH